MSICNAFFLFMSGMSDATFISESGVKERKRQSRQLISSHSKRNMMSPCTFWKKKRTRTQCNCHYASVKKKSD